MLNDLTPEQIEAIKYFMCRSAVHVGVSQWEADRGKRPPLPELYAEWMEKERRHAKALGLSDYYEQQYYSVRY